MKKLSGVEQIILSAELHGMESEPDHEVGDLQDALRIAWELLAQEGKGKLVERFFAEVADAAATYVSEVGFSVYINSSELTKPEKREIFFIEWYNALEGFGLTSDVIDHSDYVFDEWVYSDLGNVTEEDKASVFAWLNEHAESGLLNNFVLGPIKSWIREEGE